jgi:hypothetical protein
LDKRAFWESIYYARGASHIEHEENVNQQSNMKLVDKIIKESFTDLWLRRRRKEGCQYETKAISIAFNFIPFNFTILGIRKCD